MIRILDAALSLQTFCVERGWRFCFIGGLAVQRWGEPRNTQDAEDETAWPRFDQLCRQCGLRVPWRPA